MRVACGCNWGCGWNLPICQIWDANFPQRAATPQLVRKLRDGGSLRPCPDVLCALFPPCSVRTYSCPATYRAPHPLAAFISLVRPGRPRARPAGYLETSCHVSEKSHILTSSRFALSIADFALFFYEMTGLCKIRPANLVSSMRDWRGGIPAPQGHHHLVRSAVGPAGYRPTSPAWAVNPERQALPWDESPDGANLKLFLWPLHSSLLLGLRACFLHVLFTAVLSHLTTQRSWDPSPPLAPRCILRSVESARPTVSNTL